MIYLCKVVVFHSKLSFSQASLGHILSTSVAVGIAPLDMAQQVEKPINRWLEMELMNLW